LAIICINHLNILDAVWRLNAKCKAEHLQKGKESPIDEETGKEAKEKMGENEKLFTKAVPMALVQCSLSNRDKYICVCTMLHKHPYQETDLQPPKTA
jgi:hypothetical protein